jgi:hypothetical protein
MNWLLQILFALALLLVFGTSAYEAGPNEGTGWVAVNANGHPGVIVSSDDADAFGTGAEEFWMPAESDIVDVEEAIQDDQGDLAHMRQYAGVIEDGERKVFINGFCDDMGIDWQTEIVAVDDGGDCFFSAMYNVDAGELEYFQFNGPG